MVKTGVLGTVRRTVARVRRLSVSQRIGTPGRFQTRSGIVVDIDCWQHAAVAAQRDRSSFITMAEATPERASCLASSQGIDGDQRELMMFPFAVATYNVGANQEQSFSTTIQRKYMEGKLKVRCEAGDLTTTTHTKVQYRLLCTFRTGLEG